MSVYISTRLFGQLNIREQSIQSITNHYKEYENYDQYRQKQMKALLFLGVLWDAAIEIWELIAYA